MCSRDNKGNQSGKVSWWGLLGLVFFFNLLIYFVFPAFQKANAQQAVLHKENNVEVSASVGEFYLSVSGFISPYASVILTSNGIFYRATVADSQGNFYISQVLINRGFSGFCLTAIDYKKLGESVTCFSFPPAKADIVMRDLFLPPTLGLSRTEVAAGSTVIAFGYTMPYADVTLNFGGAKYKTTADKDGYYEISLKDIKAGKYQLFANAHYKGKDSLSPSKYVQLWAMNLWEQLMAFLKNLWRDIVHYFTSVGLGPLWIGIPILILIIILILKIWPEKFTFVYESKLVKLFSKKKGLHHEWFIGY